MKPRNAKSRKPAASKAHKSVPAAPPEKLCAHVTFSGLPCRVPRRKEGQYCIFHDKEWRERRRLAVVAQQRLTDRNNMGCAEGVHALLEKTAEEARLGLISVPLANTLGYLAQCMMNNLDRLQRQRAEVEEDNEPLVDFRARFLGIINDELINQQEREIAELEAQGIRHPLGASHKRLQELRAKQGHSAATKSAPAAAQPVAAPPSKPPQRAAVSPPPAPLAPPLKYDPGYTPPPHIAGSVVPSGAAAANPHTSPAPAEATVPPKNPPESSRPAVRSLTASEEINLRLFGSTG